MMVGGGGGGMWFSKSMVWGESTHNRRGLFSGGSCGFQEVQPTYQAGNIAFVTWFSIGPLNQLKKGEAPATIFGSGLFLGFSPLLTMWPQ